ncbi:MAG: DNA replication/repair protein RecF [Clostridia bacterium]|nr:DNA replication/repair protein RecF [Clostridia bacterium]
MICRSVYYRNFRNIAEQRIEFSPETNLILGPNAQGKTNALEGMYLCAQGRSHRTVHEREFIRFGETFAEVGLTYQDEQRENQLAIRYKGGRKGCQKNGVPLRKMSEFIGNFRAVLFTPEHLSIVKEGPALRRNFMDSALSQLSAGYVSSLQTYNRALLQRNKLLLSAQKGEVSGIEPLAEVWSMQLAKESAYLSAQRETYIQTLDEIVKTVFADMTGGREVPSVVYGGRRDEAEFQTLLTANLDREIRAGTTLYGIHKDDLTLTINDKEARSFASQGQQRSLALAMKLAEGELSKKETGEYPVFLLDDILSELDATRKAYILSGIRGRQVILTACEDLSAVLPGSCNIIRCEDGEYR